MKKKQKKVKFVISPNKLAYIQGRLENPLGSKVKTNNFENDPFVIDTAELMLACDSAYEHLQNHHSCIFIYFHIPTHPTNQ